MNTEFKQSSKFIKGKKYAYKDLGSVCILGLGKTGYVSADYCASLLGDRVSSVSVYAGEKSEASMRAADKLIKLGVKVIFDTEEVNGIFNLCIASPGISIKSDFYQSAKNCSEEIISEIEFAWRESDAKTTWVAITGTNGKTTTTALAANILGQVSRHVVAVGNIGNVALEAVALSARKSVYERTEVYVAEVSSYQLASTVNFAPDIAVLLNIAPDHISWHGSYEEYMRAKLSVFNNAKAAVINIDEPNSQELLAEIEKKVAKSQIIKNSKYPTMSDSSDGAAVNKYDTSSHFGLHNTNFVGVQDGDEDYFITVEYMNISHKIVRVTDLKIKGEHNYINARAAASVGVYFNIEDNIIKNGLQTLNPLEHRLEVCGYKDGLIFYNDSKATNVDASIAAMKAFKTDQAIFLLGGKDKNTPLDDLVKLANRRLYGVVCFGEAGPRIASAFENYENNTGFSKYFYCENVDNLEEAFEKAVEIAKPGMSIVLSPACSSFDEFESFEHRGSVFKELVNKR